MGHSRVRGFLMQPSFVWVCLGLCGSLGHNGGIDLGRRTVGGLLAVIVRDSPVGFVWL